MWRRISFLLQYYLFFLLFFIAQKPLFMWFQSDRLDGVTFADWFRVMWHGLPLDFSTAAYVSILPALVVAFSVWLRPALVQKIIHIYTIIIGVIICLIFATDLELYRFWDFRIDVTLLFYLQSPVNALASAPFSVYLKQLLYFAVYLAIFIFIYKILLWKKISLFSPVKWWFFPVLLFFAALLFIPVRGGFSAATMNVGWVYFSGDKQILNHAAINPTWNMLASVFEGERFDRQYRYFDDEKAENLVSDLFFTEKSGEILHVLNTDRPNIILVMLESFSATAVEALSGTPDVTPNLNRLSEEGILFTNFFANSVRTDRGINAILSAYPAQAKTSIMKYPVKTDKMPHIGKSLRAEGYHLSFYYGGDGNFTNMRSYMKNACFERFISDTDFSKKDFISSWGVPDEMVFDRMMEDLEDPKQPFFNVLLTLTSHEPFAIPVAPRFPGDDTSSLYKSSIHYTDSVIGAFIDEAKTQPWWENTLIILVSDHAFGDYPKDLVFYEPQRFHIPMLWLGGAVKQPMKCDVIGSQNDIVATLFGQMNIDYSDFRFSKNLFNPDSPHYAVYMFNNGFGLVKDGGVTVFDANSQKVLLQKGTDYLDKVKAYTQKVYDDLSQR
ncbi:MAG: LTA synthase family protein [Prevotellaceae bacterium]|jgi:phosphoglycerol transferase MdoB-like AlkP superfamily enzyme|nr:LTA synthase family protein [Prevotellaceae bacterium]